MNQIENAEELVIELKESTFKSLVVDDPSPILIDFWASWCGPCRMMKPFLAEGAKTLEGEVRVGQVNVDDERMLAEAFGISGIPTLVLLKEGKFVSRISGVMPAASLVRWVRAELGKAK